MQNTIVDFNYGVKNQARSVMQMLDREPDFADYENGYYMVRITTRPWYNGRECGFVVSMKRDNAQKAKCLHIAVFEHRNSDNICALKWVTDSDYWNHPLEDPNIFDKAYQGKDKYDVAYTVPYGESGKMAQWVYEQMELHYGPKKEKK